MKYSTGLIQTYEDAKRIAGRFDGGFIESWQLLLAMVVNPGTIAGSALSDFGFNVCDYERAAEQVVGKPVFQDAHVRSDLTVSQRVQELEDLGAFLTEESGGNELGTEHILMAMLQDPSSLAMQILIHVGFTMDKNGKNRLIDLERSIAIRARFSRETIKAFKRYVAGDTTRQEPAMMGGMPPVPQTGSLEDYTKDLTQLAKDGELDPVIGRDKELERILQILSRKTKNNPVLVGEAGVGKTALAIGLAQRIAKGQVPYRLSQMRVLELDLMSVIAGTRFRGDFEERMNMIISEVEEDGQIILFIDELHMIMGSGAGMDSTMDAANILKPALARGSLRTLGATTQDEYQKYIEKDAALVRRFAKVMIEEPTVEDSVAILQGLKMDYQRYHQVEISDAAIEAAVKNAKRYLTSKHLPDSAIDLLDETAARLQEVSETPALDSDRANLTEADLALMDRRYKKVATLLVKEEGAGTPVFKRTITAEDIDATTSQLTGIPLTKMTKQESKRYLHLEKELHKRIIGQEAAVSAVSRAIRRNQSGIRSGKRPIGSFMFLGPTGVGKTELAKALAELLFDDESALLRFDMSEYMEKFAASRLNGAPPGYVGYEEGGELTEKVRNRPYSVLLFDEIEKAHKDTFNLLLQILDDGVLTDSKGRKVDFSNTVIIMTSNLGATALRDDKSVGFGAQDYSTSQSHVEKRVFEELKKAYRPEFLNRIDDKIVFMSLSEKEVKEIAKEMVQPLRTVLAEKGIMLKIQPSAIRWLAKRGYDREMGARPLRRTIQESVEDHLAEELLKGDLKAGDHVTLGVKKGVLDWKKG